MKIVFVLLLAVAWVSTASASECKNRWSEEMCAYNKKGLPGFCKSVYYEDQAKNCKKFCGLCEITGPWNPCNVKMAGPDNTMCIYKKGVFGPRCTEHGPLSDVITSPLSEDLKQAILGRINHWRQYVASGNAPGLPAGDIPPLKWDNALAEVAQRWTDQCPDYIHAHDKNNAIKQFPKGTAQSWGQIQSPVSNELTVKEINEIVDSWYEESKSFTQHNCPVSKYSLDCVEGTGAEIGHFVMMIWAKTTDVGCGWIKYRDNERHLTVMVCNYAPMGMYQGEPIYKTS